MKEEQLIQELINQGESEQLEFLEVVRKEEIAKVLSSLLNGKGGRILVGVSDAGKAVGITNAEKHLEQLKAFLLNTIVPEAPLTISIENIDDKELLMMKVYGGSKQPYLFDGCIYYRVGQNTVKATSQQISELIHDRQKSELHWERQSALGFDLQEIDQKLILSTITESRENHRGNFEGHNILDFLSAYGLYQNGSFTNACVVLFAKTPAKYLPQIRVRLTEYGETKTDKNLLRDEIFEGNLFAIQDKLERYIGNLGIRSVFDKNQWKRIDFKFPEKALQEGIINALMHRDYSSSSGGVSISIFPDSFVISNSGHFPDDIKVNELKKSHRSHPVNPDIAHVVFLRGLIDKLGRGTLKVVDECRKEGLKDPVWKDSIDGITLTFHGPKALAAKKDTNKNDDVNELVNDGVNAVVNEVINDAVTNIVKFRLIEILRFINSNKGTKVSDLITRFNVSERTIRDNIKILIDFNLVKYIGSKKAGAYELSNKMQDKLRDKLHN